MARKSSIFASVACAAAAAALFLFLLAPPWGGVLAFPLAASSPVFYYFFCLFRLRELSRGGGLEETADLVFGAGFPMVGSLQRRAEILEFLRSLPAPPSVAAEIGRAKGGTLALLCRASSPDSLIVSLDLPGSAYGGPAALLNRAPWQRLLMKAMSGPGQELVLLDGDSSAPETGEAFARILGGRKLDLLFIDGDHSLEGVSSDYAIYSRFVRPGGVIAFHDIHPGLREGGDVWVFWKEGMLPPGGREFIEDPGRPGYGIGAVVMPGERP